MNASTLRRRIAWALIAAMATVFIMSACSQSPANSNAHADIPLKPASVDLPRYMGRWYVIAIIP